MPMWNKSLQTLMVSTIMTVGVSLSACNSNTESDTAAKEAGADNSEQTAAETSKAENPNANADLDGATAVQETPVKYDIASWGTAKVTSLSIDELKRYNQPLVKWSAPTKIAWTMPVIRRPNIDLCRMMRRIWT